MEFIYDIVNRDKNIRLDSLLILGENLILLFD